MTGLCSNQTTGPLLFIQPQRLLATSAVPVAMNPCRPLYLEWSWCPQNQLLGMAINQAFDMQVIYNKSILELMSVHCGC